MHFGGEIFLIVLVAVLILARFRVRRIRAVVRALRMMVSDVIGNERLQYRLRDLFCWTAIVAGACLGFRLVFAASGAGHFALAPAFVLGVPIGALVGAIIFRIAITLVDTLLRNRSTLNKAQR